VFSGIILIIIGFTIVYTIYNSSENPKKLNDEDLIKISYGDVQITAIYLNPKYPELDKPTFYIKFDTHSGDLYIYDIQNITSLEVGDRKYRPIDWKEDENSWKHHRMGKLTFPQEVLEVIKTEKKFKLLIDGIEGTRILEWEI